MLLSWEFKVALVVFLLFVGLRFLEIYKSDRWFPVLAWGLAAALSFGAAAYGVASLTQACFSCSPQKQEQKQIGNHQINQQAQCCCQTYQQSGQKVDCNAPTQSNSPSFMDNPSFPSTILALVAMTLAFLGGVVFKYARDATTDIEKLKKEAENSIKTLKQDFDKQVAQSRLHMHVTTHLQDLHYQIGYGNEEHYSEMVALEYWRQLISSSDPYAQPGLMEKLAVATGCHPYCPVGMKEYLELIATDSSELNREALRQGASRLLTQLGKNAR